MSKTKTEIYQTEIEPLLEQVRELCEKHDMFLISAVEIEQRKLDGGDTTQTHIEGVQRVTNDSSPMMKAAYHMYDGDLERCIRMLACIDESTLTTTPTGNIQ